MVEREQPAREDCQRTRIGQGGAAAADLQCPVGDRHPSGEGDGGGLEIQRPRRAAVADGQAAEVVTAG